VKKEVTDTVTSGGVIPMNRGVKFVPKFNSPRAKCSTINYDPKGDTKKQ